MLGRADTTGYSHNVIGRLAAHNVEISIGMPANERFDGEIHRLRFSDWRSPPGKLRPGGQVSEITVLPDWMPEGTRVIVRPKRPHAGR